MLPVEVIQLDLHKVPLVFVVVGQQMVEHGDFAMIGESQVADKALLALLHEVVQDAVVDVALHEQFHRLLTGAATDGMQQHVVDIVDLQFLERILEHLNAGLTGLGLGGEVGQFGGDEVLIALVAAQGDARGMLAQALAIGWRRVKVVHAVLNGIVHLLVDHFLVDLSIVVTAEGLTVGGRQAHHAVAQDRDFLLGLGILAIGHLAHRRLLVGGARAVPSRASHDSRRRNGGGAQAQRLEECAAAQRLAALVVVMLVVVHIIVNLSGIN